MTPASHRHDRLLRLPPVLRAGFRPFFLAGALWALTVVALWLLALTGQVELPTAFDPLAWHRHEMLFGYLGAVIAGFLLTAIPNWTGRLPLAGWPLAGLVAIWLSGRLAVLASALATPLLAAALDTGFLALLTFVAAREVIAARNRNLPMVAALALFTLANALDHAEAMGAALPAGLGWRLGFAIVLILIALIGGRIIPSFTRNWLMKQGRHDGLPGQPTPFDKGALALAAIALLGWAAAPAAGASGLLLVLAGLAHAVRLARWSGLRTRRDPLAFVLHLAYAWLPLGLLLLGASRFVWCIPVASALHALAAGAMAAMTLAVMTRATLGHTGRALHADGWTCACYVLIMLGAALRVASPMLPADYTAVVSLAGALWGGGFVLFVARYAPLLLRARPDGKP